MLLGARCRLELLTLVHSLTIGYDDGTKFLIESQGMIILTLVLKVPFPLMWPAV